MKLSRYIDSSPLNPAMTSDEVRAAITEAVRQECCSVCVQPADIPLAVQPFRTEKPPPQSRNLKHAIIWSTEQRSLTW